MTGFFLLFAVVAALGAGPEQGHGMFTLDDYDFIPPEGWPVRRQSEHLEIRNTSSGCLILLLAPQATSGNLEQDAGNVFGTMYAGWQYRNTGRQRYTLSKGLLPKGLAYVMVEASMSKPSADGTRYDGFEEGVALVVGIGSQIAIVAARHNGSLMGHDECRRYETWSRLFDSFTVRNAPTPVAVDDATRIVGEWTVSEAGAVGDYVFAANGGYGYGAALGSTSSTTRYDSTQLHLKTYSFQGDGSYSVGGGRLTLRRRGAPEEHAAIRFAQVDRGGTGWTDRLCLLKVAPDTGREFEVCYDRRTR